MDATKINRGRSKKVFACFKPPLVHHEPVHDVDALPPFSGDDVAATRKKRLRRSFSAALKAVLYKTSLKKSRSENSKQESYKLRNSFINRSKKIVNSVKKSLSCTPLETDVHINFRSNSDKSSLLFSPNSSSSSRRAPSLSSSASSRSSHSRSESSDKIKRSVSMDFKQKTTRKDCGRKDNYNLSIEIFVVWACLFALVWGKVFAIVICTSSWLFFAPAHRRRRPQKFDDNRRSSNNCM